MVTCAPTSTAIASCSSCGKPNYGAAPDYAPNGLRLYDLKVRHNEFQSTTMQFCAACLRELSMAVHPHRAGTP